jgi:hypothetical protein
MASCTKIVYSITKKISNTLSKTHMNPPKSTPVAAAHPVETGWAKEMKTLIPCT